MSLRARIVAHLNRQYHHVVARSRRLNALAARGLGRDRARLAPPPLDAMEPRLLLSGAGLESDWGDASNEVVSGIEASALNAGLGAIATPHAATAGSAGGCLLTGTFIGVTFPTTGNVAVVREGDGLYLYLEFDETFGTEPGPDLQVLLHRQIGQPTDYSPGMYVVLDPLQSTQGAQRYEISDSVDLNDFYSVVVWDRQFVRGCPRRF